MGRGREEKSDRAWVGEGRTNEQMERENREVRGGEGCGGIGGEANGSEG